MSAGHVSMTLVVALEEWYGTFWLIPGSKRILLVFIWGSMETGSASILEAIPCNENCPCSPIINVIFPATKTVPQFC
jgi:hypothetical protein